MKQYIAYLSDEFLKLSSSAISEEALEEMKDLEKEFASPTEKDEDDVKIILKRIKKSIEVNNLSFLKIEMKKLDSLCRLFLHEKFDPEFLDFISDQEFWNWVHSFNPLDPSQEDMYLITKIIYPEVNLLLKKENLFTF